MATLSVTQAMEILYSLEDKSSATAAQTPTSTLSGASPLQTPAGGYWLGMKVCHDASQQLPLVLSSCRI